MKDGTVSVAGHPRGVYEPDPDPDPEPVPGLDCVEAGLITKKYSARRIPTIASTAKVIRNQFIGYQYIYHWVSFFFQCVRPIGCP